MEKVYFSNSNGQKLCGLISNANASTAVLICHGLGEHKDDNPYNALQRKINASGIATFSIDLLGHGESNGEYDDLTLTETIDDILCAKHRLEQQGYKEIGFIGLSFGGVGGIMAASVEQFKFLVLISPPTHYDLNEIITSGIELFSELARVNKSHPDKKDATFNINFFKDYAAHDSFAAAEKIRAPVLIIHGNKDKIVPLAQSRELKKRIKGSKIKIFRGVGHHYSKAQKRLVEEVTKFVVQHKK